MPLGVLGSGRAFQSSLYKGVGGLNDHIKGPNKAYLRKYSPLNPKPYPPKGPCDSL